MGVVMKTFLLNSEGASMDGISSDLNRESTVIPALIWAADIQDLTRQAPIVLSDDEPQVTRLYEVLMARAGLQTVSIPNGNTALDYVLYHPVSLVITELSRRHINGLAFLEKIRSISWTLPIPFMVITANPDYEARKAFLALGGNAFLTKPIDGRQLMQIVTRTLSTQLVPQPP
jgi:DNA-binding NtrC family response regulator